MRGLSQEWPEIVISDGAATKLVSRAVGNGKLRKLASRLYTADLITPPEVIVRRNLWPIVGRLVPGALVADRTALTLEPAEDGSIFVISSKRRAIVLPGVVIRSRKGHAARPEDKAFISGLRLSSTARGYLENMRVSRSRSGAVKRTLPRADLEGRLETMLRRSGSKALLSLRDDARQLAQPLGLEPEFKRLDALIGALLGTREADLSTPAGIARRGGQPYDPARVERFESLHRALRSVHAAARPAPAATEALCFFEAYFSNFIEGTEFAVQEAEQIIFDGRIPESRPADAHDILGTFRIVSNVREMRRLPDRYEDLEALLKARHAAVMEGRPRLSPGIFKKVSNRAGDTLFVAPELVSGTLKTGYEIYRSLEAPFQRAVFMMFLVAEVHPFLDGNGRVARIMMNAELAAAGEQRIIIPTVFRNNYLAALRALTRNGQPEPLIRVLDFAHRYTATVNWTARETSRRILEATHAFTDPAAAEDKGVRLTIPDDVLVADIIAGRL